jgi:hypothetical protein
MTLAVVVMPSEGFCFEVENGFSVNDMIQDPLATFSMVYDI